MKLPKEQSWGIIALLSLLIAEVLIDHMLLCYLEMDVCISIIIITCIILGFTAIIINKENIHFKSQNIKEILLNLVKYSISKTPLDLLFIFFFICHLAWIPDAFSDVIKNSYPHLNVFECITHVGIYFVGLGIAILTKPTILKPVTKEPLVLITGISNYSERDHKFDLELCVRPLMVHSHITKVIIFIDPYIKVGPLPNYSSFAENKELLFNFLGEQIREQTGNSNLSINFEECDYENLKASFEKIRLLVEKLEINFEDQQLLFNLTPGNKYISIALALHSIKGNRQYCYITQSSKQLETKTLDVFEVKDIFKELNN